MCQTLLLYEKGNFFLNRAMWDCLLKLVACLSHRNIPKWNKVPSIFSIESNVSFTLSIRNGSKQFTFSDKSSDNN